MQRWLIILTTILAAEAAVRPQSPNGVVINELSTGVDWFEIANLGTASVDVSGWRLSAWHAATPAPFSFTIPGSANSGTVVLLPNETLVISENALIPVCPAGTRRYVTSPANLYPFAAGVWGSAVLADATGNGIDYLAWGNPNPMDAPFELSTWFGLGNAAPVTTHWSGGGAPSYGGLAATNDSDVLFRHTRTDTDSAADWSSFGQATGAAPDQTPGTLNRFQVPSSAAAAPLAVSFTLSSTLAIGPYDLRATNTSSGDCEAVLTLWDFDAIAHPGTVTASTFDAHHLCNPSVTTAYGVQLSMLDALGASMTAPVQTITVTVVPPIQPVATTPFIERFEGPLAANLTHADTLNGWDPRTPGITSRVRTTDPRTLAGTAFGYADATPFAGPTTAILDSYAGTAVTELILHIDLAALGGACRLRCRYYSNVDDSNAEDVFVVQDGLTTGNGVASGNVSTGTAGTDGFLETLLLDWNTNPIKRIWTRSETVIDLAWLAARGLAVTNDLRVIFRQADNGPYENGDGLLIDDVEVLALPIPGPGAAAQPGAAVFDINESRNQNGSTVGETLDPQGPFAVDIHACDPVVFRFAGEPSQPIVLMTGPLAPQAATLGAIGQLDLGVQTPNQPLPSGIAVLADGSGPNVLDLFFRTNTLGVQTLSFGASAVPPGLIIPLQCAFYNSLTVIRLSNAVVIRAL